MVFNFSTGPDDIKSLTTIRIGEDSPRYQDIIGFPVLYIGRYSYTSQLNIRSGFGEPNTQNRAYSVHIGAFTSIGWNTHFIIDEDHDYKSVTMAVSGLFGDTHRRLKRKGSIIIQNDVWIGQGCTLYGGVTIHNGAVVAGNSVVTKDVPAYSIVGGVPARVIKPRFDAETIQKLQDIQWWDWSDHEISKNRKWFQEPPEKFADYFYKRRHHTPQQEIEIPHYTKTFLFYPDFEEKFGIWERVIAEFCNQFANREDYGLLVFINQKDDVQKNLGKIEKLVQNIEAKCGVFVYAGNEEESTALFLKANYYITSRSADTVKRTNLADKFGVQILSGVDVPIFE